MRGKLIEQALKTIRNYDTLKPGDRVLIAVSGGPDSVFLFLALKALKDKLGLGRVAVCNLDHCLRGRDSRQDSLFVRKMCSDARVGFIHKRTDLKKAKSKTLSPEEISREARYKFFINTAKNYGFNVIATGHTLDDQAETVLMRLLKGTALKGIVGIPPVRYHGRVRIVRPLLEIEKEEIRRFLDEEGIGYRIDRTNLEPVYFRNVVRSEIIPFLEKYNPRLKRSLFNLAEHLREDLEFITEAKREARVRRTRSVRRKCLQVNLKDLVLQPRALQKEILRDLLEEAGGEVKRLSFRHWKALENLLTRKGKGCSIDLPGGARVTRSEKRLSFHIL
jgi:tRNA(Ile)-lysidine synthase